MRVPARIYATEKMLPQILADNAAEQAANVAWSARFHEGIASNAPDIHWGYGFPIGGVAAFDVETGVISPGGFGYDINCSVRLPDRQLACAPVNSPEGRNYLGAMRCAVNYAFANRQVIAHHTRQAFAKALGIGLAELDLRTVYEVAHNIAKLETHTVDGRQMHLCVHRKGATRAFAPGCKEIPIEYQGIGQPVLIPGDMGRYSYVLTGTEEAMRETFGSTCHGAGRAMGRVKAKKTAAGRNIIREMEAKGIIVRGQSRRTVDEEISEAYKDVSDVVDACALAGISPKVAQLKPIGCIKG
jgi:tRNA-splicing ligase RtcB